MLANACQHHDRSEPGSARDDSPAAHLANEQFEATVGERGLPDQKCTNVKSATRLDPDLPMLGEVLKQCRVCYRTFWEMASWPRAIFSA